MRRRESVDKPDSAYRLSTGEDQKAPRARHKPK